MPHKSDIPGDHSEKREGDKMKDYIFDKTQFRHDGWTIEQMVNLLDKAEEALNKHGEDFLADEICSISTALVVEFYRGAKS